MKEKKILVVNDIACDLLQFAPEDLIGKKFDEMIAKEHSQPSLPEMLIMSKDEHVISNGRVVDVYSKDNITLPVALWVSRLKSHTTEDPGRCIAMMEPVVRIVANIKIDSSGRIFDCDRETQALFGYDQSELLRMDIREVLTGLKIPSSKNDSSIDIHRRQELTARMRGGFTFPLSLRLSWDENNNINATLWVFTCMSGLLVVCSDGRISDSNSAFVQLAFGYRMNDLVGRDISSLVPDISDTKLEEYFIDGSLKRGRGLHRDGTEL
ncbi:hypothetical protein QYM36_002361, partial [Artemia franciscana]